MFFIIGVYKRNTLIIFFFLRRKINLQEILFLSILTLKTLFAFIRPFCLSPISKVHTFREGIYIMPLEELPTIPLQYLMHEKELSCPKLLNIFEL